MNSTNRPRESVEAFTFITPWDGSRIPASITALRNGVLRLPFSLKLADTQKIWQNQHGFHSQKRNLIRFVNFNKKTFTKKMFFHTQHLTSLDPYSNHGQGSLSCPWWWDHSFAKNSRLLDESSFFFPPKNHRDILWSLKLPLFYISNGLNLYRCGKWVCLFKQNDGCL